MAPEDGGGVGVGVGAGAGAGAGVGGGGIGVGELPKICAANSFTTVVSTESRFPKNVLPPERSKPASVWKIQPAAPASRASVAA